MIPLAVPNLAGNEARYLDECVSSTFVSSVGPFVGRFEEQVADAAGTAGAVAVSSGTAGLQLALRSVGVGRDDLVVLPAFTFIASANAVVHCGATPWLFDVAESTWTLDPEQVNAVLRRRLVPGPNGPVVRESGRRLAAIMPVHTLGHPADMAPLVAIGDEFGVPVVADAAAALGGRYRGLPIGHCGALASVFSFNGNKTVTCGGGGAIVTDDDELLARVRHLSSTARVGQDYDHDAVGFNFRMTNLQAAVGCAQMERLDQLVTAKRRIHRFYRAEFARIDGLVPAPEAPWAESACWFSAFLMEDRSGSEAEAVRRALRDRGVDARPFWKPMHLQQPFANAPHEQQATADKLWERVLTLPCSTGISDDELGAVADAVQEVLG